jgi:hypothetical protein
MLYVSLAAQDPHAVAYFVLMVSHMGAAFMFRFLHKWMWISYLVCAIGYGIVLGSSLPSVPPPSPLPVTEMFARC